MMIYSDSMTVRVCCILKKDLTVNQEFIWLEFLEINDLEYPSLNLYYDHVPYIYNTFLPNLKAYLEGEDASDLFHPPLWQVLAEDKEFAQEIIDLLEETLKDKWYNIESK